MKILIIQENGRHDANRHLRECHSMKRAFNSHNVDCDVWGLGHENYEEAPDFESYDLIINLENYDEAGWVPDLSEIRTPVKFLWVIDAHFRGMGPYLREYVRGEYDLILQATKDFLGKNSIWLPNAYDDDYVKPDGGEKLYDVGFCGNILNRGGLLNLIDAEFGVKKDIFVIGEDMVKAINSYKVHVNANISCDFNYRNLETIGCGTILAAHDSTEQYELLGFKDGENCILFKTMEEFKEKVRKVLADDSYRTKMSKEEKKLAKKHTYKVRAKTIIEEWKTLKKEQL